MTNAEARAFLRDIMEVCRRHRMTVEPEDAQCGLEVVPLRGDGGDDPESNGLHCLHYASLPEPELPGT